MALWPFGRKKRKAQRAEEKTGDDADLGITTQITGPEASKINRKGRASKPSSKQSSRKVSKSRSHDTSQSPNTPPPLPILSGIVSAVLPPPPPPPIPNEQNPELEQTHPGPSRQPLAELSNPQEAHPSAPFTKGELGYSQTSIQPENFSYLEHAPTLRPARASAADLSRRKSSKRKAESKAREQEIKSMSTPIPIPKRPRSFTASPLARDSKQIPGGLNRNLSRPTSEVSLPLAESLRSSISATTDMHNSFRVSAFDALSPRPTIRYSESPRYTGSPFGNSRSSARKEKGPMIPEEDFSPRARVDNLADDMDASGLRELMERDRRRSERKKKSDRAKLERRLQRRLEKQRALATGEAEPSEDEAMVGVRDDDIGIPDQPKPVEIRAEPASSPAAKSDHSWLQDPSKERLDRPFNNPMDQSHLELGTDDEREEEEEPVVQTAQAIRLSTASLSPPASPALHQHARGPSGLSQVTSVSPAHLDDIPEPATSNYLQADDSRRDSETSARLGSSWKSFFRRGGTIAQRRESSDKGRNTPSEFSNTSRESFIRQNKQPPPLVQRSFKPKDGVPKRTRSKFREDLPELPNSPLPRGPQTPDAPVSPVSPVSPASPYIDHSSKISTMNEQARTHTPLGDVHPAFRDEIALSRGHSVRSQTPEGASAALLSQSLASVDSEGSWLSGKPQKRSSIPISSVRESVGSLEQFQEAPETTDEYFTRRSTSPAKPGRSGLTSQFKREQSGVTDPDDVSRAASPNEEPKYATVHEGKATLVQRAPAIRSREGLLDMFNADEEKSNDISPVSSASAETPTEGSPPPQPEPVSVHRATSVNMVRRHSRQVSAGSARLLDIPARSSIEGKRSSIASSQGSPLMTSETIENPEAEKTPRKTRDS